MAALPYMQLYVADYLADTWHLTTEQHGAYLLLIMNYWQTGKAIRKEDLSAIARMNNDRWASVEVSLQRFFTKDQNGCWFHLRIEEDLAKVRSKSTQASEAGKASARKRALKKLNQTSDNVDDSNGRSNSVEHPNQQTFNHTETEKETNTKQKRTVFKSPTIKEVLAYCQERGNLVDPEAFINFYESKGWMIGKNKMKSWKAAVRTWEKNDNGKTHQSAHDKRAEISSYITKQGETAAAELAAGEGVIQKV